MVPNLMSHHNFDRLTFHSVPSSGQLDFVLYFGSGPTVCKTDDLYTVYSDIDDDDTHR